MRQTLFDWLAPMIDGARVLDLFAGSGALGLEALSRGAAQVDFVEQGAAQAHAIEAALRRLDAAAQAAVIRGDALAFLRNTAARYDVVLLDPPYDAGLLEPVLALLPRVLAPVNRIYVEGPKGHALQLPPRYERLKDKAAGQVSYGLIAYTEASS